MINSIRNINSGSISFYRVLNTLTSLVGINLLVAGISFITTMLIANVLGRKSFGDYSFAVAVGTYGLMFTQYGLEKSFVRELVHFPNRFGELFKASLLLKASLFLVFLFFSLAAVFIFIKPHGFSWGMILIVIATAFTAFQLQGVYDAWQEMRRHAIYYMIERCFFCVMVWLAFVVPFVKLSIELIGIFLITAVTVGLFIQYKWALPRIEFKSNEAIWSSTLFIVRSNFFIWLAVLSGLSIDYMSQIILKLYSGSSELGLYSVAWKIAQLGTLFLVQAGRIGSEATARYTRPEESTYQRKKFLIKYVALMTMMGIFVGMPCLLFPQYILKLFRPEYANAADTLRLFGLYPLLYGPYLAVLQYVISMRMQKTYFGLITVVGFISIILSMWLIPQMQSKGAVISVLVSLAIALILFITAVWSQLIYERSSDGST